MKKVCAFIIIVMLAVFLAGSGCTEKASSASPESSMPVLEIRKKDLRRSSSLSVPEQG